MEASGADLLPIDHRILGCPHASQATSRMLDNLDFPTQRLLDPGDEAAFILATISPEVLEARKTALQWSQHQAATGVILDVGFMHDTISFQIESSLPD